MLKSALARAKDRAAQGPQSSPADPRQLPAPLSDVNDERHGLRQALRGMGLGANPASSTPASSGTARTLGEDAAKIDGVWQSDGSQHTSKRQMTVEEARLPTQQVLPKNGKPVMKVLYLFSGTDRKASIASYLKDLCIPEGYGVDFWEIDIHVGGSSHDLLNKDVQEDFLARVEAGEFDVVILSPPCGSWSRAN